MWILNHYLDYHFVSGKYLQALLLAKHNKVGVDEPDWNWRLTVVQSERKINSISMYLSTRITVRLRPRNAHCLPPFKEKMIDSTATYINIF